MDYLVHHMFLTSAGRDPEKICVMDGRLSLSYDQLASRAGYLSARLLEAGVRRGDRVAFYLDHNVEQAVAILAISAAGGAFVPINAVLFPEQVEHIVRDSGARVLLTTEARRRNLSEALARCPELRHVWTIERIRGTARLERNCGAIENDLAAILYTSGSTGRPKGVMLSHRNLVAGSQIVSEYLGLRADDRLLGVLTLSFDYGLNQLLTMFLQGGTYRFLGSHFPEDIVRALQEDDITGFAGMPPIWALLVRSTLVHTPLPRLRYVTNSGGAVPTRVLELLCQALPTTNVVLMYGLTEAFRSTFLPPSELSARPTSIGKAIPNTEILVVGKDGRLCGPNEEGELVHRGPTVAMGYWNRPEETAERFRAVDFDGVSVAGHERVVFSGDLVKKDEEGFLYYIGRRDAMIKCSGYRISPTEIEEVVFGSGTVKEAAAVGAPDGVAGQVVKVYVRPLDEWRARGVEIERNIIDYCAKHLPGYMVPRRVEIIETLPKTAAGKIDYPTLRAMA